MNARQRGFVRGVVRALAFVAYTGVVTLVLLEGALRVFDLVGDNVPIRYRAIAGDEDIAPLPHGEGTSVLGILHRTNSLGLRCRERPAEKPAGTWRVAVVGDSVAWGQGVAEDDGFVAQLEGLVTAPGKRIEVWNLGVPASNTFNHAARFARLAPALRPDVTVVALLYNDLAPGPVRFRVTAGGSLAVPGRKAPFPEGWKPALERVALYWAATSHLGAFFTATPSGDDAATPPLSHFPAMANRLDAMLATANAVPSRLVVALVPGRHPPPEDYRALEAKLAEYARQRGVPFLSLAGVLGNPVRTELFLPSDSTHPTAAGHRLVAKALAPLLH